MCLPRLRPSSARCHHQAPSPTSQPVERAMRRSRNITTQLHSVHHDSSPTARAPAADPSLYDIGAARMFDGCLVSVVSPVVFRFRRNPSNLIFSRWRAPGHGDVVTTISGTPTATRDRGALLSLRYLIKMTKAGAPTTCASEMPMLVVNTTRCSGVEEHTNDSNTPDLHR